MNYLTVLGDRQCKRLCGPMTRVPAQSDQLLPSIFRRAQVCCF